MTKNRLASQVGANRPIVSNQYDPTAGTLGLIMTRSNEK